MDLFVFVVEKERKIMMKRTLTACVAITMAGATCAIGQIQMNEISRVNLDPTASQANPWSIGNNPSAVAWNGSSLFVGGFNQSGGNANTAIAKVTPIIGAVSGHGFELGGSFGTLSTPTSRGISGMAIQGDRLAVAWDSGVDSGNGIRLFDLNGNQLWNKTTRGGSGVAFDPGFNGVDSGVAYTAFGSGRRALQDTATGSDIYTTANGMIINDGAGTFWRSMDFDPNTGDLYARRSNGLIKTTRTGGNSGSVSTLIPFANSADFVNGHNLAFVSDSLFGDFVIYNNRPTGTEGQLASNVITVLDSAGSPMTIDFTLIGGGTFADGNGYYDFSWDSASGTLAVMDFFNRNVHIFQVVPTPSTVGALALGGLVASRRRRS